MFMGRGGGGGGSAFGSRCLLLSASFFRGRTFCQAATCAAAIVKSSWKQFEVVRSSLCRFAGESANVVIVDSVRGLRACASYATKWHT